MELLGALCHRLFIDLDLLRGGKQCEVALRCLEDKVRDRLACDRHAAACFCVALLNSPARPEVEQVLLHRHRRQEVVGVEVEKLWPHSPTRRAAFRDARDEPGLR